MSRVSHADPDVFPRGPSSLPNVHPVSCAGAVETPFRFFAAVEGPRQIVCCDVERSRKGANITHLHNHTCLGNQLGLMRGVEAGLRDRRAVQLQSMQMEGYASLERCWVLVF